MIRIANRKSLLVNASSPIIRKAREIVQDAIEDAFKAVDPKEVVRSKVTLDGDQLDVNGKIFDLAGFERIFVMGGGKASGSMAEAIEEILGERIEDGLIVVPHGTASQYKTKQIKFHEASHPVPDESSVQAARKLLDLASQTEENDLIIFLISGGGSSLIAIPRDGIPLTDKRKVTEMLLRSGATINEMNTIRKHISGFKGGFFARRVYPATIISLLLSDVIGDQLDVIASGPTVPDSTTFHDAVHILKKYDLWKKTPMSIRSVLSNGVKRLIQETPKSDDPAFRRAHNIIIGNNRLACSAAIESLNKSGLKTLFLTSFAKGEARDLGIMLAAIGKEIIAAGNPLQRPVGVVIGGETTVTVTGKGRGGRNQEIALAASLEIDCLERIVVASASTDGIDGPTDAAGAIVDGDTITRSEEMKLDAKEHLKNNDSYSFFSKLGDLICTGPSGTNVNDLSILVVL